LSSPFNRQESDARGVPPVKILHILKSEPDDTVAEMTAAMNVDDTVSVIMLYDETVDWDALVDTVFENDKVICWW
jgi:hypothetical protein